MSDETVTVSDTQPTSRFRAPIMITIAIIAALVVGFFAFAGVYADVLWYQQLGFLQVLTTRWASILALAAIGFVTMAVPTWAAMQIAYRARPVYTRLNAQLNRYQTVFEPLRRLALYGIPTLLGVFAAVASGSRWDVALAWLNRTPFGTKDPQFGLDASFYVFELPFYRGVLGLVSAALLLAGVLLIATNYLYGAVRVSGKDLIISKSARVQISTAAGLYVLVQAGSILLDQFSSVTQTGQLITGATYAGVHATIPGQQILAIVALLVAVLFFVTAVIGRWRFPLIGTALLVVASLVLGSLYPWVVQRFQVVPSEAALEEPYIQRNIDSTRGAYGLSAIEEVPYQAKSTAQPGALRSDAATTANIRLMDPTKISPAFQQLEQYRQYYQFPSDLDVDRYQINGKTQDTVISVRDLNLQGLGNARTWYNSHLVYTHGYGLVAAAGNQRASDGQPVFIQSGIPSAGSLGTFEPRIYFGQYSPDYSIVGAPAGGSSIELDYPAGGTDDRTQTTFTGNGGPKLDNIFTRLVYALKFQSEQIVLSDKVTNDSQILYDRDPLQRVAKVAPYLRLDSDTYPSVVDGRIVWIVDGYTTTNQFPYSNQVKMDDAIADSETVLTSRGSQNQINYIRNSVKATVDAYDGKVTLYSWDESDPILKTWEKVFPSTVKPMSAMSGQLMSHVRYPSDLFKVQRYMLGRYHVTQSVPFYQREDAWTTPKDPTEESSKALLQPPYYLTMQMPGQTVPSYSLYSTFIPEARGEQSRNVLRGYLAVNSDAGTQDGQRSGDYGKLRLLILPEGDNVPGPGQVQNTFNSDPTVGQKLNILKQGQSSVINGNLLTIPVGGGLLYVQPVYVKSTGSTSYPLLQKVLVAFGDRIAFEDTLNTALDVLFGGDSGASAGDSTTASPSTTLPAPPSVPGAAQDSPAPGAASVTTQSLLQQASVQLKAKQAALAAGDWAAYGAADTKLTEVINQLVALNPAPAVATPTPSPSAGTQ